MTNASNFDERSLISKIPKSINEKPDILVLGSSRINSIKSEYFNKKLINTSVSSAVLYDLIINYQFFKKNNKLPKEKIIIGIDPWLFNEKNPESRWMRYESIYKDFLDGKKRNNYNINEIPISYYFQLISFSYFQNSLKRFMKNNIDLLPTNLKYNKEYATILGVFSRSPSIREIEYPLHQINKNVSNYFIDHGIRINNFNEISNELVNLFEKLIIDMKKQNLDIELLIIPYHPEIYETINSDFPKIIETEEILHNLVKKYDISIYGSFDPKEISFDKMDFQDGLHCTEMGLKKLVISALSKD